MKTTLITPIADTNGEYIPLPKCRLACKAGGTLWPFPTGEVRIGSKVVSVNVGDFSYVKPRILISEMLKHFPTLDK